MNRLHWLLLLALASGLFAQRQHYIQDPRYHTFEEVEAELVEGDTGLGVDAVALVGGAVGEVVGVPHGDHLIGLPGDA